MNKAITKEWMAKKESSVKDIIDDSITNLMLEGMKRESALALLAFQCIIRMDDKVKLRSLLKSIEDRLDGPDDDEDA
jgi:hypothetical protein